VDSLLQQQDSFPQEERRPSASVPATNQDQGFDVVRVENETASSNTLPDANLTQRLQHLEEQMRSSPNGEAIARMEALQDEVQLLRGQVEQLTHQLEQTQSQQKTLYAELDKRLMQNNQQSTPAINPPASDSEVPTPGSVDDIQVKRVELSKPLVKPAEETSNKKIKLAPTMEASQVVQQSVEPVIAVQPNAAEEQKIYQSAYNLIKEKKYNDAVTVLQKMLKKYPSGQFASNAHYWLGELFGLMGKHDQALTEFKMIVKSHPHSSRVSDAQLKVGLILASQLKWTDAKVALKRVVSQYPGTSSAKMASEQLKQIKLAGH
jgi:tol-pal system protein YbgF